MSYTNGNAHKFAVWRGPMFVRMFTSLEDAVVFARVEEDGWEENCEVRRVSDADQREITRQVTARGLGAWL